MDNFFKLILGVLLIGTLFFSACDISSPNDEPGFVEGIVGNAQTGELLVGIRVHDGENDLAFTDENGFYSFQLDKGSYNFFFSGENFITHLEEQVEVKAGKTTELNVLLNPVEIVEITGNIGSLGANWTSAKIYHINNEITIAGPLTIGQGTIIKFKENAAWNVDGENGGRITAIGTELEPIIFSSWHDDDAGGDTNGNGNATAPDKGDWQNISLEGIGNDSEFSHCIFRYGGWQDDVIELKTGTQVSITYCLFAHNVAEKGAIDASDAASGTVIQNNLFYDNEWPLNINLSISLDNSNTFHEPGRNSSNLNDAVMVNGDSYESTAEWSQTEIPFVFLQDSYQLNSGTSLTIGPGVVFKFNENSYWQINGVLQANGEQANPIYFTSYRDDAVGGDTNNDGSATTPAVGDWDYVKIEGLNNSSSLNYVILRYGGGSIYDDFTVHLGTNTSVSIKNCQFYFNNGLDDCVLDAKNAGSGTVLLYNIFYSNEKPLGINGSISLDETNVFVNFNSPSLETNTYNGIFVKSGSNINGNITWLEAQVPYVLSGQTFINSGNSLTLGENVILKFDGGSLYYQGDNLINHDAAGVWFTSYFDDDHGGDTNGDGSATSPAAGDWQGINNQGSWEDWENILYSAN